MSMYRTVTVMPEITSGVTITATVTSVLVTVIPSLYDEITVEPFLHDGVVEVSPTLSDSMIDTSAEIYTEIRTYGGSADYYTGSYEFTPTQETQTIDIGGLLATHDITINPIPSNYGLVTWNGSYLTIS